jgi:hypothetical protein
MLAGNPDATSPDFPTVYLHRSDQLVELYLPEEQSHHPTAASQDFVGTFTGALYQLEDAALNELKGTPLRVPVLAISGYKDQVTLFGGGDGVFSAYHPQGGYCPVEASSPDLRAIVALGDNVLLLSRPPIASDTNQSVMSLEPINEPSNGRCN